MRRRLVLAAIAGHTNGDAFVVFRELRTMHAGDIMSSKGTPLLDMNNGGRGSTP